jgi:rhamnogalacturonan endolyase
MRQKNLTSFVILTLCIFVMPANSQRIMEKLGRGFVAVGTGNGYLLSWRLYGTEQGSDIAFNVYKGTTKLNAEPITDSTNYLDKSSGSGDYTLKAVVGGTEQSEVVKAMVLKNNYIEIPLKDAGGRRIHLAYVADLDGDGEYEYVVDRMQRNTNQYLEAYHRTTGFMWRVDMGPNSENTDNSRPGPAAIGCGHADNICAYDIDCDGKAEVLVKGANGTIFGDGKVLSHSDNTTGFILALDGKTGAEKARIEVPHDLDDVWPITGHFSIAYFDGVHPSLMFKAKAGGTRAMMDIAYDWKDGGWKLRWNSGSLTPMLDYPNFHQIRCVDVDQDGVDEFVNGAYCRNADGKIIWNQKDQGVIHGDRWHIGDLDPDRPGLEGFAIQQRNSSFGCYYYDAKDGTVLKKFDCGGRDIGRGTAGDVDPAHRGYEMWAGAMGMYTVQELDTPLTRSSLPPVNFRIWWDGDLLSENLDRNIVSKWAYPGIPSDAFSRTTLDGIYGSRNAAPIYGDFFGDWREEVLLEKSDSSAFRVYTTTHVTDKRIYTLVHNPEYRISLCEKGYMQSHMVDYYLGDGMSDPPKPNITYPNAR